MQAEIIQYSLEVLGIERAIAFGDRLTPIVDNARVRKENNFPAVLKKTAMPFRFFGADLGMAGCFFFGGRLRFVFASNIVLARFLTMARVITSCSSPSSLGSGNCTRVSWFSDA